MRLDYILVLIVLSFQIGGCAFQPIAPVPTDHYYRLPEPESVLKKKIFNGEVLVRRFHGSGLYMERALLFSKDPQGLVLEQHHYHFWYDTPPRMLQSQLVSWLRKMGAAPQVVTDSGIEHQYVITSRIQRFERILHAGTATVVVALELQLRKRHAKRVLLVREYREEIDIPDIKVQSAIHAYGKALDSIFLRFVEDAEKALQQD